MMQGDKRAARPLQGFIVREVLEGFSVSNSRCEGPPRECQKQLLFVITE
jgi:hypothetical protein